MLHPYGNSCLSFQPNHFRILPWSSILSAAFDSPCIRNSSTFCWLQCPSLRQLWPLLPAETTFNINFILPSTFRSISVASVVSVVSHPPWWSPLLCLADHSWNAPWAHSSTCLRTYLLFVLQFHSPESSSWTRWISVNHLFIQLFLHSLASSNLRPHLSCHHRRPKIWPLTIAEQMPV